VLSDALLGFARNQVRPVAHLDEEDTAVAFDNDEGRVAIANLAKRIVLRG
jgi:hypothetical protein